MKTIARGDNPAPKATVVLEGTRCGSSGG